MGGPLEQPKEEPMENKEEKEHKVTTPEEAAEITQQRRKDFGLEEAKELVQEQVEELEGFIEKLLGDFAVEIERADSFFAEIEKLKERATGFVHPDAIEQLALEAEKRHIARFYEDRIETLVKANQIQEIKPLLETLVEGPLKEGLMSYAAQLLLEPFKREIETIDPFGNWATMKRRYTQLRNCLKAAGITGDALTGTLDEARILMEEQFVNYIALSLAQGEDVGDWISDLIQMEVIKEDYAVHFISAVAERRDQFLAIDA